MTARVVLPLALCGACSVLAALLVTHSPTGRHTGTQTAATTTPRPKEHPMPIRPENRARYPKNWPEISASIRFDRAKKRCECLGECGRGTHEGRCSNLHGGLAYGTGSRVILTVAHLDHTPENCDPANLRAMCQGCHLHYDKDHHRQTAAATRRAAIEAAGQTAAFPA